MAAARPRGSGYSLARLAAGVAAGPRRPRHRRRSGEVAVPRGKWSGRGWTGAYHGSSVGDDGIRDGPSSDGHGSSGYGGHGVHEALVELRARGNDGEAGSSVGVDQEGRDGGWRRRELGVAGNGVCALAVRDDLGRRNATRARRQRRGFSMGDWMKHQQAPAMSLYEMVNGKDMFESIQDDATTRAGFYECMDADTRLVMHAVVSESPAMFHGLTSLVDVGGAVAQPRLPSPAPSHTSTAPSWTDLMLSPRLLPAPD
ncbi:unnamed protein product [Miscanthus lutarioriparius]|uniref:O-methyltransferase C-terminal domain-containing protein n=1 Tax=Miscanthus lutarioriparius TaxID=422564 RepID=A0A811QLR2_9POAL|nr:unnamed protein product [Miscanthus lutarioriparius]